jgi:hypothetical protein
MLIIDQFEGRKSLNLIEICKTNTNRQININSIIVEVGIN